MQATYQQLTCFDIIISQVESYLLKNNWLKKLNGYYVPIKYY